MYLDKYLPAITPYSPAGNNLQNNQTNNNLSPSGVKTAQEIQNSKHRFLVDPVTDRARLFAIGAR